MIAYGNGYQNGVRDALIVAAKWLVITTVSVAIGMRVARVIMARLVR